MKSPSPIRRFVNGVDVTAHGGLIVMVAKRFRGYIGGAIEWEDILQAGWLGLHRAAEKFDPEQGTKFSTYATHWIRNGIQRCIMNERRLVRVPVHAQEDARKRGELIPLDGYSLDAPLNSSEGDSETFLDRTVCGNPSPEDAAIAADSTRKTERMLRKLSTIDQRVVRLRIWGEYTLAEIGRDFGVTRERIRQREEKSLERIGRMVEGNQ